MVDREDDPTLSSWWRVVYVAFVHDATGDVIEAIAPGREPSDADAIELGRAMVHKNAVGQIDSLKRGRWRALKMHAQAAADDGAFFRRRRRAPRPRPLLVSG